MDDRAIGIMDAGFGGLAAVAGIASALPNEDVIYLSDIAHFPYEKESAGDIREHICRSAGFLAEKNVKLIIDVCDCACPGLPEKFPESIPLVGIHLPAAQAACSSTKNGRIGVIGNSFSGKSLMINKAVKTIRPGTSVVGSVSPLISPAVLSGYPDSKPDVFRAVLDDCIAPVKAEGADTIVLGSALFEFIAEQIRKSAGSQVTVVAPVHEAVKAAELLLFERGLLSEKTSEGSVSYFINGEPEFFRENAARLCGGKLNGKIYGCTIG